MTDLLLIVADVAFYREKRRVFFYGEKRRKNLVARRRILEMRQADLESHERIDEMRQAMNDLNEIGAGLESHERIDEMTRSENFESARRRIDEMRQAMNDLNEIDADLESQERIYEMRQTLSELEGVTTTTTTFIGDIQQEDTRAKRKQHIQQQLFLQPLEDASVRSIQKSLELSKIKEEENLFRMMWRNNKRRQRSSSKGNNRNRNTEEGQECSICLCDYQVGEIVAWPRNNGECTHVFHEDCITDWLQEKDDCPLCRTNIMNRDPPTP